MRDCGNDSCTIYTTPTPDGGKIVHEPGGGTTKVEKGKATPQTPSRPKGKPRNPADAVRLGGVTIYKTDPYYDRVRQAYQNFSNWKECFWICTEGKKWGNVCMVVQGFCNEQFERSVWNPIDESFLSGGSVALGSDDYYRNFTQPHTMVGVTQDELRAMVPEDWVEQPLKKGSGVRIGSPPKRDGSGFGRNGWVEFNNGVPGIQDPLHQKPFVRLAAGGLQYRVPAAGNPLTAQGASAVQMLPGSGAPGNSLKGARTFRIR